jgi:hypothetical protein
VKHGCHSRRNTCCDTCSILAQFYQAPWRRRAAETVARQLLLVLYH